MSEAMLVRAVLANIGGDTGKGGGWRHGRGMARGGDERMADGGRRGSGGAIFFNCATW